jgi:serine/threonine protein kinase
MALAHHVKHCCSQGHAGTEELTDGEMVAIKKIRDVFNNLTDAKRILREISLLSRLRHPNLVSIKDIPKPPTVLDEFRDLYIVFE